MIAAVCPWRMGLIVVGLLAVGGNSPQARMHAASQNGPVGRRAPAEFSEILLFQDLRYWQVSLLDDCVTETGTVADLVRTYPHVDPEQFVCAAMPGDFDQDGRGDLLLLQDSRYVIAQLETTRELSYGGTERFGIDPARPPDGAAVIAKRFLIIAQGNLLEIVRFDLGLPYHFDTIVLESPVDAIVAWQRLIFLFSGNTVTRVDVDSGRRTVFGLTELGLEGPVDTASLGPSSPMDSYPALWVCKGTELWAASLRGRGARSYPLEQVAAQLHLEDVNPTIGFTCMSGYSLEEILWPWGFYHVELQWGYRDPWAGDPPPANTDPFPWDGELRPGGPEMRIPTLRSLHGLSGMDGRPALGALFSWTHTNMMEPSKLFPGGRRVGAGDGYCGPQNKTGIYHYFAGGFSWRSVTTADWDGVDSGFYYTLREAPISTITIRFGDVGWERTLPIGEFIGWHPIERMDGAGHTLEIGEVDTLPTDVADVFLEFGHLGSHHGGGSDRPCPPDGFLAVWDGYFRVTGGEGYLHLAQKIDLEEGGSYDRGTDDYLYPPFQRTAFVSWRASTVDRDPRKQVVPQWDPLLPTDFEFCHREIDGAGVEVAIPNPRLYGTPLTTVQGGAGAVVVNFPPLEPPHEWCVEADGQTGYDHTVHGMVHWCFFNSYGHEH